MYGSFMERVERRKEFFDYAAAMVMARLGRDGFEIFEPAHIIAESKLNYMEVDDDTMDEFNHQIAEARYKNQQVYVEQDIIEDNLFQNTYDEEDSHQP